MTDREVDQLTVSVLEARGYKVTKIEGYASPRNFRSKRDPFGADHLAISEKETLLVQSTARGSQGPREKSLVLEHEKNGIHSEKASRRVLLFVWDEKKGAPGVFRCQEFELIEAPQGPVFVPEAAFDRVLDRKGSQTGSSRRKPPKKRAGLDSPPYR